MLRSSVFSSSKVIRNAEKRDQLYNFILKSPKTRSVKRYLNVATTNYRRCYEILNTQIQSYHNILIQFKNIFCLDYINTLFYSYDFFNNFINSTMGS